MASVQQLKSRIGQLRVELRNLETQLLAEECREAGLVDGALVEETTFTIGGVGSIGTGRSGAFVAKRGRAGIIVRLCKKNGSVGSREAIFYNWRHVA